MKQLDEKVLYEKYKEIMRVCLTSGVLVPSLISPVHIPMKYRLTDEEQGRISTDKDKLKERYRERRAVERRICEGEDKDYSTLSDYWLDELETFVKEFPQFEDIIIDE